MLIFPIDKHYPRESGLVQFDHKHLSLIITLCDLAKLLGIAICMSTGCNARCNDMACQALIIPYVPYITEYIMLATCTTATHVNLVRKLYSSLISVLICAVAKSHINVPRRVQP